MPDTTYQPKVYKKDGGNTQVVASGGVLDVESGGSFKLNGTAITPTAAEINVLAAATPGVAASNLATVADGAFGIPVVYRKDIADAATANYDYTLPYKVRVVDAYVVKTANAGGAANTVQVLSTANAITDAMSININDQTVARAATIDDANHEIAAGGKLRVTVTKAGGNAACIVYVTCVKVA